MFSRRENSKGKTFCCFVVVSNESSRECAVLIKIQVSDLSALISFLKAELKLIECVLIGVLI